MNHKNLLTVQSILLFIAGLVTLIIPNQYIATYGLTLQEGGVGLARLYGATIIMGAVITWAARSSGPSDARKAIVLGLFVGNLLAVIVGIFNALAGGFGPVIWGNVVLWLLLGLVFGFFYFTKSEEA